VLLHGWGMQGKFFDEQIAALAPDFRVVVPDLRGHGRSSPLTMGQGLPTLVDDVNQLLVNLELSESILIGWSMGAMVAWGVMQGLAADRIAGLVTIDMVPRLLNDTDWKFGLREGKDASVFSPIAKRMIEDWPGFTRFFVPRIFATGQCDERMAMTDRMVNETEKNDPESMARLWMSMAEQDFRGDLSKIDLPALVIHGALSQLYSEAANAWVADQMPDARRVAFANSGHAPHIEEPDLFDREIKKFAGEIGDYIGGGPQSDSN
jgi:pimeloyl-[acyl-carrier protein] methyl ester esterase